MAIKNDSSDDLQSEINVVPLVDIILVVLKVFILKFKLITIMQI